MSEATRSIGERLGDLAHQVGGAAGKKAEQSADQSLKKGADLASALGEKVDSFADRIDEKAPSLAQQVRDTADKVNQLADQLNEKKVSDLVQSAADYGRAHPFVMMAGAALLGFALARFIGSGSSHSSESDRVS